MNGGNTLDRLIFPEIERWERAESEVTRTLEYYHKDSGNFVKLYGNERIDSLLVYSKLPRSAMNLNERTMTVMQDDGSTREIREEFEVIRGRPTYILVSTKQLTDTATVDCILEAFVKAIKNGV